MDALIDDHADTSLPNDQCRNSQSAVESSAGSGRPFPVSRPGGRAITKPYPLPEGDRNATPTWNRPHQQRKEGDLIIGSASGSAIGTLVERSTRYVMLVHLPNGHSAENVRDGLVDTIATLPVHLRRSLTWDQGTEMARHREVTLATDMAIYFCDPHSPWQRGSNENTNGLLRQYFPKGTNLNAHSTERLVEVATELNQRPRKTLGGITPAAALEKLLSNPPKPSVATTA